MAVKPRNTGLRPDDLTAIGPYWSTRNRGIEGNQAVNLTGGPYKHQKYRAKLNVGLTNKNVTASTAPSAIRSRSLSPKESWIWRPRSWGWIRLTSEKSI
jgi:hypothetical protein